MIDSIPTLYDEFQSALNERLDNTEALLEEMICSVNANSDSINETLHEVSSEVGYTMTDEMQSIWSDSTKPAILLKKKK